MNELKKCLQEEARAISESANRIDIISAEKALKILYECSESRQKLITTGIGKSGIVARKIAATFSSVGLMSIFLNPLDALHGDLGIVGNKDVCLFLSNSGESQELLEIVPHLKLRGTKCLAIVGSLNSSLAKNCEVALDASVDKEICPLNLAPTASTAVAMAIGDALATVWMQKSGVTHNDFAINHPAGNLGRKLTLRVKDLMVSIKDFVPINKESEISEIITMITKSGIGSTWVEDPINKKEIIGLITDGDLRRALENNESIAWNKLTANDLMTKNPITINDNKLAIDAISLMENNEKKPISVLPVLNDSKKMVGILRLHDLVQAGIK